MEIPQRQGARNRPKPCPFQVGDRIRPNGGYDYHDYEQGRTYLVADIDPISQTLRARDESGSVGSAIRWVDCTGIQDIGWHWIKDHLPADTIELLAAFDGLERLKLRDDITTTLVTEAPSLREGILRYAKQLETQTPTT